MGGLLKDSGCKELTDREARPFAPLSACADPWLNVFSDDLTLLGGWMHGTGGRDATGFHFGEELVLAQRIYREHSGMFVGSMEILRTIADAERFRGFRIEPCEGVEPLLKPDRFVVPLAADQDGDGEVECWTADDQGRVRRLHDD